MITQKNEEEPQRKSPKETFGLMYCVLYFVIHIAQLFLDLSIGSKETLMLFSRYCCRKLLLGIKSRSVRNK